MHLPQWVTQRDHAALYAVATIKPPQRESNMVRNMAHGNIDGRVLEIFGDIRSYSGVLVQSYLGVDCWPTTLFEVRVSSHYLQP